MKLLEIYRIYTPQQVQKKQLFEKNQKKISMKRFISQNKKIFMEMNFNDRLIFSNKRQYKKEKKLIWIYFEDKWKKKQQYERICKTNIILNEKIQKLHSMIKEKKF